MHQAPFQNAAEPFASEAPIVLSMQDIHHAYGRHTAVAGINLTVRQGEVVCLLGPSGCGKTTLLRIVAGLEVLQRGHVEINGRPLGQPHVPPEHRNVGLAFQESALFPHLSVLENVTFGLASLPARQRRARAMELLALLGMEDYAGSYPHTLSGGQQQRVALARAWRRNPA